MAMPVMVRLEHKKFAAETEVESTWRRWLEYRRRGIHDIYEVLKGRYREEFKKRALFILLVPNYDWIPWPWKKEFDSDGNVFGSDAGLKKFSLSPDLIDYTAYLVRGYVQLLQTEPDVVIKDAPRALTTYNEYLLQLIGMSEHNVAKSLFKLFSLRDITVWASPEKASGYNPFRRLLYSKGVPAIWKKLADSEMRITVTAEIRGKQHPRTAHEDACECYVEIVKEAQYHKDSMEVELFADQISFIVQYCPQGKELFRSWEVEDILNMLVAEEHHAVRDRLIKFVVFQNGKGFYVSGEKDLKLAKKMLTLTENKVVMLMLNKLITIGILTIRRDSAAANRERAKEDAILNRMFV